MNSIATFIIFYLISSILLLKNPKFFLTFSNSSINKQDDLITLRVIIKMFPLLESKTLNSIASRKLIDYSKFIFDINLLSKKHLASIIPLDFEKELTK